MPQEHANPDARASGRTINWRTTLTWISVVILVGTEVVGAAFAGAWALAGVLELPQTFRWGLYGLAAIASAAVMVPFMRRAASVEALSYKEEEGQS